MKSCPCVSETRYVVVVVVHCTHCTEFEQPVTLKCTQDNVLDFLVLRKRHELALRRNWAPGMRFSSYINGVWYSGVVVEKRPHDDAYPDSPWKSLLVAWDSEDPAELTGPWELEVPTLNASPSRVSPSVLSPRIGGVPDDSPLQILSPDFHERASQAPFVKSEHTTICRACKGAHRAHTCGKKKKAANGGKPSELAAATAAQASPTAGAAEMSVDAPHEAQSDTLQKPPANSGEGEKLSIPNSALSSSMDVDVGMGIPSEPPGYVDMSKEVESTKPVKSEVPTDANVGISEEAGASATEGASDSVLGEKGPDTGPDRAAAEMCVEIVDPTANGPVTDLAATESSVTIVASPSSIGQGPGSGAAKMDVEDVPLSLKEPEAGPASAEMNLEITSPSKDNEPIEVEEIPEERRTELFEMLSKVARLPISRIFRYAVEFESVPDYLLQVR